MPTTSRPRPAEAAPGRPRSKLARRAVLDAALELVARGGYPAATIDAIAARSGVAKTTIYRGWPNRSALMVDLLVELAASVAPPPAGRDPLKALRTELHMVAEASEALPGQLLISLLGEAQQDPVTRRALLDGLFIPRRAATARVIRQAQALGLLRPDVPPLVAVDLLFGPLFYRRYVRLEHVSRGFVQQVFRHALAGLRPRPVKRN